MLENDILCDLSRLSWLVVAGDDAESFLQSQLSNDVKALDGAHSQVHGYCNPKGRLIAILRVVRLADGFLAQVPATLCNAVVERLRKYVLRARVTIDPAHDLAAIGVSGEHAATTLTKRLGALPDADNGFRVDGDLGISRIPGGVPRLQVVGPETRVQSLRQRLARELDRGTSEHWSLLDIRAGFPEIVPETSELFVPQMVNLDLVGGISFKKGCYPGQEIVARMHYLGKLKQRTIRAEVTTEARPEPGNKIYAPRFGEQSAGTVLQAEAVAPQRFELLAVVQMSAYRGGELVLHATSGAALQPLPLPYALPEA